MSHHYRSLFVLFCALFALAGASFAQPRKAERKVSLTIAEVSKEDARAVERGGKRFVPVSAKVKRLADDEELLERRLISLNVSLVTKNTDGTSTSLTEQMTMPGDNILRLTLPMKKGVFAKDFILLVRVFDNKRQVSLAEKRGSF